MSEMPYGYEMMQDPDIVHGFMQDVNRMMEQNFELLEFIQDLQNELSDVREAAFQIAVTAAHGNKRRARRLYRKNIGRRASWRSI
jgi:hypothetical protein